MRILLCIVAGAALLVSACSADKPTTALQTPRPPTPEVQQLIAVDPSELPLPADQMIGGNWKAQEGTIARPQYNRAWKRDPNDPGAAVGATEATITTRLYGSLQDSQADFADTATGDGASQGIQLAIAVRGFDPKNIHVSQVDMGKLGADQESAWRAEFGRGTATETYVQYFVYLHVRNTRAMVTAFAQNKDGTEAPKLFEETKQIALKQVARLRSQPISPQPIVTFTPPPSTAISTTPTPRPN